MLSSRAGLRALIVGINYTDTPFSLKGCINDTERVRDLLVRHYGVTNPVVMTDAREPRHALYPTRVNILRQLEALVDSLGEGDCGFFHFAGHGHIPTLASGEATTAMLVPIDAVKQLKVGTRETLVRRWEELTPESMLDNDALWSVLSKLRSRASLFVLLDACHTGDLIELPFLLKVTGPSTCNVVRSKDRVSDERSGSLIILSACAEAEKSADTEIDGRPTGALTFAFCETIKRMPSISYLALVKALRAFMEANLPASMRQTPQISFNRPQDCLRAFRIGDADLKVVGSRSLQKAGPVLSDAPSFWNA